MNNLKITLLIAALITAGNVSTVKVMANEQAVSTHRLSEVNCQTPLSFHNNTYIKDTIWLYEGCVLYFDRVNSFPVIIVNIDTKTSTFLESRKAAQPFEISEDGRYLVFCADGENLRCINDILIIDYPCNNPEEIILL